MPDVLPTDPESATVYDLFGSDCPLCGGELGPVWDASTPRLCLGCGARIRLGVLP